MENTPEKLHFDDPIFIFSLIGAGFSDFLFLFSIGIVIPVIGQVLGAILIGIHFVMGIILLLFLFSKIHHFLPRLVLGLSILLPLPTLSIGIFLAIILQNRIVEFLLVQAVAAAATAATAPIGGVGGAAVEGAAAAGAVGEMTAEGVALATEGAVANEAKTLGSGVAALTDKSAPSEIGEEVFGVSEPTEKTKELFEFQSDEARKEGWDLRQRARDRFRDILEDDIRGSERDKEEEEREVELEEELSAGTKQLHELRDMEDVQKPLQEVEEKSPHEVELNEDENSVNLKKAV